MKDESTDSVEPYRILFPLGALVGALGVLLWVMFSWRFIQFFPRKAHSHLMFFGFLWSFVAGFMMTAVPKMTRTSAASYLEIFTACLFVLIQLVLNIRSMSDHSVHIFAAQNIFLLIFFGRRFWVHRVLPFSGFVFIPVAFLQSFLGALLFYLNSSTQFVYLLCGEAFLMNLIFGLGSRLVPVISRLPDALSPTEASKANLWLKPLAVLTLVNLGYLLEAFGWDEVGKLTRLLGLIFGAVMMIGLFRVPTRWSISGVGLKLSVVFILLGQTLNLSFFDWKLAGLHLTYIGGFSLITILISVRVMLAHGQQELDYEVNSRRLSLIVLSFLSAAVLRALSGNQIISLGMTLSVFLFSAGLALWAWKFMRILQNLSQQK